MKINYPIKYAVMPIVEQVGWSHGLHEMEREYDVVCYIVSKCYLINDLTKYNENGSVTKEYEVVFPYQSGEFSRWKRVIPTYNLIHGYCINGNKVDKIFDSYEDALKYATDMNKNICEKSWVHLPCSKDIMEKIKEKKDEFDTKLAEYKLLEQQILLHTQDMKIGNGKELSNVIKIVDNSGRILSCNIYEIINLFDREKFVVYSVSLEQYSSLIKLISEDKIGNIKSLIRTHQGLLLHNKKDDFIRLAIEEGCGAYYIQNNRINYDVNLDKVNLKSFENLDNDTIIFYTTETIDDILNSYKKYSEIDLRELNESSIKKVKKYV